MATPDVSAQRRIPIGLRYMIGAAFAFSLMSLFVKMAGQHIPSQQIVLVRSVVTLFYSYLLLRWAGQPLWGHNKRLLILRGFFGFAALSCFFFALTKLPLADATVIHYTNPVFTALLAAFFLDESLGKSESAGALLSMVGVVLIAQPGFLFGGSADLPTLYVGISMLGALLSAAAYVTVRKLRETERPLVIVFYFPLVTLVGATPTALPNAVWPTPMEWLILIVGVGLCAQVGQVLLTHGLHEERAGRAMSMSYLQIVFAAVWGLLFFQEVPGPLSIGGALLVVAGTLLVARQ